MNRIVAADAKVGHEISFSGLFYIKPLVLCSLAEIKADIRALELQVEDLLSDIISDMAS